MEYKSGGFGKTANGGNGDGGGEFSGYASTWGGPDAVGDIVSRGAYSATLAEGRRIPLLWQHQTDKPIGHLTLANEDDTGLFIKARIKPTRQGKDALVLLSGDEPSISGLSIGYDPVKARRGQAGLRTLERIKLYEVSIVTFSACEGAEILSVSSKSALRDLLVIGEVEAMQAARLPVSGGKMRRYVDALLRDSERKMFSGHTLKWWQNECFFLSLDLERALHGGLTWDQWRTRKLRELSSMG